MLPVVVDESRRVGADSAPAIELKVRPTPAGLANAALQLGTTEAANRARWDSMPPLTSVNRFRGVKPGATSLLVGGPPGGGGSAGEVVFASHRYGRGKALALTIQDTWLWRMHASVPVEDRSHQTFWRQLLRWLLEDVPDRLEVTTTPEQASPRQRVTVRAELADSNFLRVNDAVVLARITAPSGDTLALPLEWALGRDGSYAGEFTAHEEGRYRIEVEAVRGRDTVRAEPELLLVADQGLDYLNAEMRAPLLRRIAEETGGRFYTPETLEHLPDDVVYTQSGVTVTEARDLWDMPAVFLLLLLLLGAEWGYRRKRWLV